LIALLAFLQAKKIEEKTSLPVCKLCYLVGCNAKLLIPIDLCHLNFHNYCTSCKFQCFLLELYWLFGVSCTWAPKMLVLLGKL